MHKTPTQHFCRWAERIRSNATNFSVHSEVLFRYIGVGLGRTFRIFFCEFLGDLLHFKGVTLPFWGDFLFSCCIRRGVWVCWAGGLCALWRLC